MSGDTFTTPNRYESSTEFNDGNVLEFRMKSRDDLKSQSAVEAERDVHTAYNLRATELEYQPTEVEIAARQLALLHEARIERMAA